MRIVSLVAVLVLAAVVNAGLPNTASDTMHQQAASQPVNWMTQVSANDIVKTAVLVAGSNATVVVYEDLNTPHFDVFDTVTGALFGRVSVPNCTGIRYITALATPQLLFVSCGRIGRTYHMSSLTVIATIYPPASFSFANVYPIGGGATDMLWIDVATDSLVSYNTSIGYDMATGVTKWSAMFSKAKVGQLHAVDCAALRWCAVYSPDLSSTIMAVSASTGATLSSYKIAPASYPLGIVAGSTDTACMSNCLVVFWSQQIQPIVLQLTQADNDWGFTQLSHLDTIPQKSILYVSPFRPARLGMVQPWYVAVAYNVGNVTWHPAATGEMQTSWATPGVRGFNLVDVTPSATNPSWVFFLSIHDATHLTQSQTGAGFRLIAGSNTTWSLNSAEPIWTTTLDNVFSTTTGVYPVMLSPDGTRVFVVYPGTISVGVTDTLHRFVSFINIGTGNIETNLIFPPTLNNIRKADLPLYDPTTSAYIAWTQLPNGIASFSAVSHVRTTNTAGTGTMSSLSWNGKLTSIMSDGTVSTVSILPNSETLVVSATPAQLPRNLLITDSGAFTLPDLQHKVTYFSGYNLTHGCFGIIENDPKIVSIKCYPDVFFLGASLNSGYTHLVAYADSAVYVMLTMNGETLPPYLYQNSVVYQAIIDNDFLYVASQYVIEGHSLSKLSNGWVIPKGAYGVSFGLTSGLATRTLAFCAIGGGFYEAARATGNLTMTIPQLTCSPLIAIQQSVYYLINTVNSTSFIQGVGFGAKFMTVQVSLPTWIWNQPTVIRRTSFTVTNDRVGLLATPSQLFAFDLVNDRFLWSTSNGTALKAFSVSSDGLSVFTLERFTSTAGAFSAITAYNTITGTRLMQVQTMGTNTMAVVGYPTASSPCTTLFADDGFSNGILFYDCLPTDVPYRPANWNPNAPPITLPGSSTPAPTILHDDDDGSDAKAVVAVVVVVLLLGSASIGGYVFYRRRRMNGSGGFSRGVEGYSSVDSAVDMKSLRASSVA